MIIEIHTPGTQVKERITDYIKEKLMELHRRGTSISNARIYFWQQVKTQNGNKACEVDLTLSGDSLFIYRKSYSYEQAMSEVLEELGKKLGIRDK